MDPKDRLLEKIKTKKAKIGIIGLGYVGLPLLIRFGEEGFKVFGFDIDEKKISMLKEGKSYIKHIDSEKIKELIDKEILYPALDYSLLKDMDCIIICVPTPLNEKREPELRYIWETTEEIAKNIRVGQLISLESTTYPGTTREILLPKFEEKRLKAGKYFFLVFSPERENPGDKKYNTKNIPKLVGGITRDCTKVGKTLYGQIVERVIEVSSPEVAEAAKLLENIYRAVNIALVNELKMLFDRMGIDIWEVIEAAKTKPFGFQPFYPGPGLGGHCIPIDPFYLTWKAREYDFHTRFIELAGEINTSMPYYVVEKTIRALNSRSIPIKGAKILIIGVAYKPDVDDLRESPALRIMELLEREGAIVDYHDPYIPKLPKTRRYDFKKASVSLTKENLSRYDAVLIITNHASIDYGLILENAKLIVDTRNAIRSNGIENNKVWKA